jgi:hypothetical protein
MGLHRKLKPMVVAELLNIYLPERAQLDEDAWYGWILDFKIDIL